MLARLARDLPRGDLTYEPKWDGFRCLAFVDPTAVDLRSRHDRPLSRYFPEVAAALAEVRDQRRGAAGFVLDGELLLAGEGDFATLMGRLHPAASRVERLSVETPARYVAFDVLALGGRDLRDEPFVERRRELESLISGDGTISLTPATRDPAVATQWVDDPLPGTDGVVAKSDDLRYEAGRRRMTKVKRQRTADCVVAGMRLGAPRLVGSLLLGLYDDSGDLRHVGVVTQLQRTERATAFADLAPLAIPLSSHPWRDGFSIRASPLGRLPGSAARWTPDMEHDWIPLAPVRVAEVGFDQVDGDRFRHPAHLLRWRPDRVATSCHLDQILRSTAATAV